ncbi:ABC transporter ATP-binding protein [Alteribacter natronophilus]|nr:ABC transporter ATP-binding protein [Alteribacter natronophilus]
MKKRIIVNNISLKIRKGEVFGLLGPNGAGKTTIIRMMTGLIRPTAGKVEICGYSVKDEFEKAASLTGAVVENPEMYGYLSGWDNLIHCAKMHGGVSEDRIREILRLVDLEERIGDKVRTYSLGMRQRLGLAQSLLHRPQVLILDEPTNGLDPAGIREMREYLGKLAREENICVIVSSHLLSEMEKMCDRVAIIHRGECIRMEELKSPDENGRQKWFIAAEGDLKRTEKLLNDLVHSYETAAGGIRVSADREKIPECLSRLIGEGILVFEVRADEKATLEEEFLSITGGVVS